MSKYILMTFYKDVRNGKEVWLVYGHVAPGVNEDRGEFKTKDGALDECFRHGVPVMPGRNYDLVLERLVLAETNP